MAICESCGRDENDVTKVQRIYLLAQGEPGDPATGSEAPPTPAAGDIEYWCASCCSTFPHRLIEVE